MTRQLSLRGAIPTVGKREECSHELRLLKKWSGIETVRQRLNGSDPCLFLRQEEPNVGGLSRAFVRFVRESGVIGA